MKTDIIKQFNLPSSLKDKTFAKASEIIENKFKDRDDNVSKNTKEELLQRLADAQEYVKMQEALKANSKEVPDLMNGEIPEGMEEFAKGGSLKRSEDYGSSKKLYPSVSSSDFAGGNRSYPIPTKADAIDALRLAGLHGRSDVRSKVYDKYLSLKKAYEGYTNDYLFGGMFGSSNNDVIAGDQQDNQIIDKTKDTIATAIGPIGMAFRGAQKLGQGIGSAIGGNAGAVVADIFSPEESTISVWKDSDANIGQKILGTVPGVGGVVARGLAKRKAAEEATKQSQIQNKLYRESDFAYGGKMNKPNIGYQAYQNGGGLDLSSIFAVTPEAQENLNIYGTQLPVQTPTFNPTEKTSTFGKVADWLGENYGSIMRYAPVASNLLELSNLEKAVAPRRDRLSARYRTTPVDEASLINKIQDYNVNRALSEASGGDLGALRSNILAANLNRTRALSEAMISAEDINRQQADRAQQFNLGLDQFNIGQSNLDLVDKMATEGRYETIKSNLKRALAEDIGAIGQEQVNKKLVRDMFGYTWDGKYYIDAQGRKYTPEEVRFQIQEVNKRNSTNESNFGGFLKLKKSKDGSY